MTPDRFTGTWRRTSISIDGALPSEPAEVVWIQVGDVYADLRVPHHPGEPVGSFAGTTSWEAPSLRWSHELDLVTGGTDDVGAITGEGDDLVESGTFELDGRTVPYLERWRRQPTGAGEVLALRRSDGHGILVRSDDHAITVCDDRHSGGAHLACYRTCTAGTWSAVLVLGAGSTSLPEPPEVPSGAGWVLLDGHRWQVVHASRSTTDQVLTPHPEGAQP